MILELLELNYTGKTLTLIQWNKSHRASEITSFISIEAFATDEIVHYKK